MWQLRPTCTLLLLTLAGCAGQPPQQASTPEVNLPNDGMARCNQVGFASWYRGSSKARASPQDLVAAHRSLPLGTSIRVTVLGSDQSIVVRVNDRGPYGRGRIIDLSKAAALQLGILHDGVARVRLEPVGVTGETCPFQQARAD